MVKSKIMKYVHVIYDPLLEQVLCVHDKPNKRCRKCNKKKYEERKAYQLESVKRKIIITK